MKNKTIILLLVAIFLPLSATHAQGLDSESTIEQLQQKIEILEQSSVALQKQLEIATRVFTRALYRGVTGAQVQALQEFLKQFPDIYPEGFVTGYFGALTQNAVQRFQTKEGILALGIVGPITRARLNERMTVASVETGSPGPTGATGAIGPSGATGSPGPVGATGPIGETGSPGPAGSTGPIGDTGLPGPVGETGTPGPIGPVGETGTTSPAGPIGETGIAGPVGPVGPIGATGSPGPTGATGAAGLAGPIGGVGPNFLTVSVVSGNINKNHTFFIISGGSFTTGNAYCVMVTAPGANKTDTFIISVGGTTIGTCVVSGTAIFGSTTLTPVGISPGTVVQITTSTNGSGRIGALTIAP